MEKGVPHHAPEPTEATRPARESRDAAPLRTGAKALFTADEQVLLVRERHADGSPFWTLPGGGVEPGETAATALRRELREELRCRCTIGRPVGACVYRHQSDGPLVTTYTVFAAVLETEPKPNPAEGVVDCAWHPPDALSERTLAPFRDLLADACRPD